MSDLPSVATKNTAALALLKNAAFFAIQTFLGYFLMLAVMMYNAFIFLSVIGGKKLLLSSIFQEYTLNIILNCCSLILGMFMGHLLFGHLTLKYNVESIRAVQTEIARSKTCPGEGEICALNGLTEL